MDFSSFSLLFEFFLPLIFVSFPFSLGPVKHWTGWRGDEESCSFHFFCFFVCFCVVFCVCFLFGCYSDIGRVGEERWIFTAQGTGTGSFTPPQSNNRVQKISFFHLLRTVDHFFLFCWPLVGTISKIAHTNSWTVAQNLFDTLPNEQTAPNLR